MFNTDDLDLWNLYLSKYEFVLNQFSIKKKKISLVNLDSWFHNVLGNELQKNQHLTKEQLVKVMEWKLTKGIFRPSLQNLIKENDSNSVIKFSENAFKLVDTCEAIKELCNLRGVGPATASAILTAFSPERFGFMSDESVKEVLPGKIKYTFNYYQTYLEKISEKANDLTIKDNRRWTPCDVEKALWSSSVTKILKLNLKKVVSDSEVQNESQHNNCLALVVRAPLKRELNDFLIDVSTKKKQKKN
ncbi:uncharacterized protein LOC124817662 isoform X1 [Hydra vulgaris]|uniref:uncharacterized protein LOC124817662 isoform X1 n=1 Tax=Hydra vulgaris TaxID=6087 RepID=UPI001F5FB7EF|nr:uncharacterized protein LOC124817662 [Hydra vulgaris]